MGEFRDVRDGKGIAATFGTAFHFLAEKILDDFRDEGLTSEMRVKVGTIPGYGPVSGSVDVYDRANAHVVDFKCLSRKKIQNYMRTATFTDDGAIRVDDTRWESSTLLKYYYQQQLYGKGVSDLGYKVERLSLLMVPRDATVETIEKGVRELSFAYNEDAAQSVLDRAAAMYDYLSDGGSTADLPSDKYCYHCRYNR